MILLPYENLTWKTELNTKEIQQKIAPILEPKIHFRLGKSEYNKPYEGVISNNIFTINRIIEYRNTFLPIIHGKLEERRDVTIIHLKLKLNPFVIAFLLLFTLMSISIGFIFISSSLYENSLNFFDFLPLLFLPFIYTIIMVPFKVESKKSKIYLYKLLEVQ